MARILCLGPGYVPPAEDERESSCFYLSREHEGDIIQPVWGQRGSQQLRQSVGRFDYHFTHSYRLPGFVRVAWDILFTIVKGKSLQRTHKRKSDVIICYGWNKTGIAGLALKWLTGAKLIVEVPGTPKAAQLFQTEKPGLLARFRSELNGWLLKFILKRCDGVKLLYPTQVDGFLPANKSISSAVYHDLVPVNSLAPLDVDEKYILLVGYPWYLKGVDLLIRAFKQVADEFPGYRLRIIGHCPDRSFFEHLRNGDDRIEFVPGVRHDEAIRQIAKCSVFVLASRTEAMGRVLLEAMALRKPIVASRVDGIPHYIQDDVNGLLFESGNVPELASQLRRVLIDRQFAGRLAQNGHQIVHEKYSETRYAQAFDALIDSVLSRPNTSHADAGICDSAPLCSPRN